jgi:hypothetical protein
MTLQNSLQTWNTKRFKQDSASIKTSSAKHGFSLSRIEIMENEKIEVDIVLQERVERAWTHYDVECLNKDGRCIGTHHSSHYGVYSPPYPAHYNDEKFNGKIELKELYERLFPREEFHDNVKYYINHRAETEVEIQNVYMKKMGGKKMKFELIK